MKNLLFAGLSALLLISCKKESSPQEDASAAKEIKNLSYGSDPAQKMDLYLPKGRSTDSTKLIILVHGGAWAEGDKTELDEYIPSLRERLGNYAVANINYRLATGAGNFFPTQENDIRSAIDWLVQKSGEYKYSSNIVLLGASAGAHLSLLQAYKNNSPKIAAVVDFYGPADMAALYSQSLLPIAQAGLQMLLSGTPQTNAMAYQQSSPINFVDAGDPPTIIFHGLNDTVVPVSQSASLLAKLKGLQIDAELHTYGGLGHERWPAATMTDALDKTEKFLKAHVK